MKRILLLAAAVGAVAFGSGCRQTAPQTFTLTREGVGSLVVGKPFSDRSKSGEGLYNRFEKERLYDESSGIYITFYDVFWDDEHVASFMAMDAPDDGIYKIAVYSPRIVTESGVKVGMPLCEALTLPGVKAWYNQDIDEITDCGFCVNVGWGYEIGKYGLGWLLPDMPEPGCLTRRAQKKCRGYEGFEDRPLEAADFNPETLVGEIRMEKND